MRVPIIGLAGNAGAGKDTAGEVIARKTNGGCIAFAHPMKRFCQDAFGFTHDQLWGDFKEKPVSHAQRNLWEGQFWRETTPQQLMMVLASTCKTPELMERGLEGHLQHWWDGVRFKENLTPRQVLQTFGTEFGRQHLGKNFWVDIGLRDAFFLLATPRYFYNMIAITDVRFRNEVLAIKRAGGMVVRILRESKAEKTHQSETELDTIPKRWFDFIIHNEFDSKEAFENEIGRWAGHL